MGTRKVTRTTTEIAYTCDICGKDCSRHGDRHCFACGREGGYCCVSGLQLAPGDTRLLELFVPVCKDCRALGPGVIDAIRGVIGQADGEVMRLRGQWRAASEAARQPVSPATPRDATHA